MLVENKCMGCGKTFTGPEPQMCCSGKDCGCRGLPTEPVVCSEDCYQDVIKNGITYGQKEVTNAAKKAGK